MRCLSSQGREQAHSAEVSRRTAEARRAAAGAAEAPASAAAGGEGYTLATMFGGRHRAQGAALLGSFAAVQGAWSLAQSILNMYGDEDFTQWLVLLCHPADMLGRLASHALHGLIPAIAAAPVVALHSLTVAVVTVMLTLIADTWLRFLDAGTVDAVVSALCCAVAFNLNELAVKSMQVAKCRAQVSHCQNYAFFGATGAAKLGALILQIVSGTS